MTFFTTLVIVFGTLSFICSGLVVAAGMLASRRKQPAEWIETYEKPVSNLTDAQAQTTK